MANNEFKDIEQFIEGFTRNGPTPKDYYYDGVIYGMDFEYNGKIYRITRDTVSMRKELQTRFNKSRNASIQLYEIPVQQYPNECVDDINLYIGIFEDVNDLLDNGIIDEKRLREIIASDKTTILAID